ncbi:hypothetical protein DUI87_06899 [Hirundo rustica rustica]|uniref:Uncharacterized protein n=1 Tax=Hirundo rustica rustica TaxID=333673 RepID=A0A3M0KNV2_HIRRU|nr:hypothetical protein DUI87_06899 [Hirundo rustica rustica]
MDLSLEVKDYVTDKPLSREQENGKARKGEYGKAERIWGGDDGCPPPTDVTTKGYGTVGGSPEEATKLIMGLEPLPCGDRLGQLGLLSLEKIVWKLPSIFKFLKGPPGEPKRDFSSGTGVIGQGVMGSD